MHTSHSRTSLTSRRLLAGAAVDAACTTAPLTVISLGTALRACPAGKAPVPISGDEEQRGERVFGLGPLLGLAAGLTAGAVLGVVSCTRPRYGTALSATVLRAAALAAADTMAVLGTGILPYAAYGLTAPRAANRQPPATEMTGRARTVVPVRRRR
jgi:hypothetical protein